MDIDNEIAAALENNIKKGKLPGHVELNCDQDCNKQSMQRGILAEGLNGGCGHRSRMTFWKSEVIARTEEY